MNYEQKDSDRKKKKSKTIGNICKYTPDTWQRPSVKRINIINCFVSHTIMMAHTL